MIKVVIADDQVLLREMLSMILTAEDGIEVVGLAGNGEEIISLCRETAPDLALLDLKMPGSGGIHALEAIKEMPHIKAVMLTTFSDEKSVLEAFQRGGRLCTEGYQTGAAGDGCKMCLLWVVCHARRVSRGLFAKI